MRIESNFLSSQSQPLLIASYITQQKYVHMQAYITFKINVPLYIQCSIHFNLLNTIIYPVWYFILYKL